MNIKNDIAKFFNKHEITYFDISNEHINTIHNILFQYHIPSLDDHYELLYYYALYNHIDSKYNIALIYYQQIINNNKNLTKNHIIGSTCNNLGILYDHGNGVPINTKLAIKYYKLSIKHNRYMELYISL